MHTDIWFIFSSTIVCSYVAKICIASCVAIWLYIMLDFPFVLLEQATSTTTITTITTDTNTTTTVVTATGSIDNKPVTMPRNTTSSDSNKVSQNRNSAEHIMLNPLTKGVPSIAPSKPKPKPRKLKLITNTENENIGYSVSPGSISSAACDMDKVDNCQNVSEQNLPVPHIPPASEQFSMHIEESTDVAVNFQSNTQ